MSKVTRYLPITAKFDGCFCNRRCAYLRVDEDGYQDCLICPEDVCSVQGLAFVDVDIKKIRYSAHPLLYKYHSVYIRTHWCCETFGMGDFVAMKDLPSNFYLSPTAWLNFDEASGTRHDATGNGNDMEPLEGWMNE